MSGLLRLRCRSPAIAIRDHEQNGFAQVPLLNDELPICARFALAGDQARQGGVAEQFLGPSGQHFHERAVANARKGSAENTRGGRRLQHSKAKTSPMK